MTRKNQSLDRIDKTWHQRATVRRYHPADPNDFQLEKKDFLPEWLPFGAHPDYLALDPVTQQKILSIAWLCYNQATIDIEYRLVIPFCLHTVETQSAFRNSEQWRHLLFETITDESYHVQLTETASQITRQHRQLLNVTLPDSFILTTMQRYQAQFHEPWQKQLIALATCIVTEIVIGEHLGVVAKAKDPALQPLVKSTTLAHMQDESVHAKIFQQILNQHYTEFNQKQMHFFNQQLPRIIAWFMQGKLHSWKSILPKLGIKKANEILGDCAKHVAETVDYNLNDLNEVADSFGLKDLTDKVLSHLHHEQHILQS